MDYACSRGRGAGGRSAAERTAEGFHVQGPALSSVTFLKGTPHTSQDTAANLGLCWRPCAGE
eukprot:4158781-Prymnesium_polylepis.1